MNGNEKSKQTNKHGSETARLATSELRSTAWLGRVAWTTYRRVVGGVAWNGDTLPEWEEMVNELSDQHQQKDSTGANPK